MKAIPYDYRKSKKIWAFMDHFIIGYLDDVYLDRWAVITTPWFSIKFHRIFRPDRQRDLHDHPWSFLSIILLGSYYEDTPKGLKRRRWFNWKRAEDQHSIREVSRRPVWTLLICGPRRRSWGFWVDDKFIPWKEYDKLTEA